MNQRLLTRLLALFLLCSLVFNVWMLLENRRLLQEWDEPAAETLQVHVAGAVHQPGVYSLAKGARVSDALERAGGVLPEAELGNTNLAKPLYDGEQVLVAAAAPAQAIASSLPTTSSPPVQSTGSNRLININTATAAELDTLPYIGPSKAAAIIAYRQEHGAFARVEDLLNVSGIGEATLAKFKQLVTVK
jgi:competence protein ComEA